MPEIDKLLQISNRFGVTLDYLLKDECSSEDNQNNGYYVSRKIIDGFLSYKRQGAKRIALGFGLMIFSNFFCCFSNYRQLLTSIYWVATAIGASVLVWHFFQPKQYQYIYHNLLIFDEKEIKDFRTESNTNKKRYIFMIILGVLILILGPQISFLIKDVLDSEMCRGISWLLNTAWVILFILAGTSIHMENIITQNSDFLQRKTSRVNK